MSTIMGSQDAGSQATGQSQGGSPAAGAVSVSNPASSGVSAPPSWRDSLSAELKDNVTLKNYNSLEDLAKSHVHAQTMIGKKGVVMPTKESSDEEWNKFYDEAGRPPQDKYEVKVPDGYEVKPELVTKFKEFAYKNGLSLRQAEGFLKDYLPFEKEAITQSKQAQEQAQETAMVEKVKMLQKEWGDGFDKNAKLANYAIEALGSKADLEYFSKNPAIGNDPIVAKLLAKAGGVLGGEKKILGDGTGKFGKTPAEVQAEVDRLHAHPGYSDKNHADHSRIDKELQYLYPLLYTKTG